MASQDVATVSGVAQTARTVTVIISLKAVHEPTVALRRKYVVSFRLEGVYIVSVAPGISSNVELSVLYCHR
ncbi:MAG: hypothetical protein LBF59_04105 [Prevotellaceae bacterium]|nr:hypothetical protein [Prevotellaceae bacterium]